MPPFPMYVIPFPLPIVPSPGSCPCYLVNPGKNDSSTPSQSQGQGAPTNQGHYAPYGIIGFIPVVFVPYCPGNASGMTTAQQNFPSAVPVPYNCAQCQANSDAYRYIGRWNAGRSTNFGDLKEIRSLAELENLLRNEIKPMKKSLRRIAMHPRMLSDSKTTEKEASKNEV